MRQRAVFLVFVLLWAFLPGDAAPKKGKKKRQPETAADLRVVDCLLPGKIRRLGRNNTFTTPRQPVRTSAFDCELRGGEYTAFDRASYATSLKVWLTAAEAGDAEAQTYVGEIFEKGLAARPDYEMAAVWYRRAADQGDTRAMINLGHLYEKGLGVDFDPDLALQWYRRAAGLGEAVVLDWAEQEAELRRETAELGAEIEKLHGELEGALERLEAARSEVEKLRRELEAARRSGEQSAEESAALESRLRESEAALEAARGAADGFRDRLARLEARGSTSAVVAGPSIAILEPDVLSTRGPKVVAVPGGVSEIAIRGRVTAPAGLDELKVDERAAGVDASGFFEVEAAVAGKRTLVIEAVDARGRTTRSELLLEPGVAPSPPIVPVPVPPPPPRLPSLDHHALVLSVARYENLEPLKTVEADTAEVERLLSEKYGYRTTVLRDPTHFDILNAINGLAGRLEEKDHLVIYYAGHGKVRDGKGYWIGIDGAADNPSLWIPNEAISDQLDVMKAKHVMVISDSCYSGTLTRSGVGRSATPEASVRLGAKRSRTVLTSGGLAPVLDEGGGRFSIFAQAFLRVLELNESDLAGADLHREVAARVRFAARRLGFRQRPDYAPIRYAGHEAGDFVLAPGAGG